MSTSRAIWRKASPSSREQISVLRIFALSFLAGAFAFPIAVIISMLILAAFSKPAPDDLTSYLVAFLPWTLSFLTGGFIAHRLLRRRGRLPVQSTFAIVALYYVCPLLLSLIPPSVLGWSTRTVVYQSRTYPNNEVREVAVSRYRFRPGTQFRFRRRWEFPEYDSRVDFGYYNIERVTRVEWKDAEKRCVLTSTMSSFPA